MTIWQGTTFFVLLCLPWCLAGNLRLAHDPAKMAGDEPDGSTEEMVVSYEAVINPYVDEEAAFASHVTKNAEMENQERVPLNIKGYKSTVKKKPISKLKAANKTPALAVSTTTLKTPKGQHSSPMGQHTYGTSFTGPGTESIPGMYGSSTGYTGHTGQRPKQYTEVDLLSCKCKCLCDEPICSDPSTMDAHTVDAHTGYTTAPPTPVPTVRLPIHPFTFPIQPLYIPIHPCTSLCLINHLISTHQSLYIVITGEAVGLAATNNCAYGAPSYTS